MRLNEVVYSGAVPVEGYGPGFFRLGGKVYEGPILVMPGGVSSWGGIGDAAAILAEKDSIDVLFIGLGAEIAPLEARFRARLEEAGIGVEIMASPPACRTYNVLLSEGRRVGLALLPV